MATGDRKYRVTKVIHDLEQSPIGLAFQFKYRVLHATPALTDYKDGDAVTNHDAVGIVAGDTLAQAKTKIQTWAEANVAALSGATPE